MAVNYSKINQVVVLIAATVVASFLEHINMFSGTWYVAIDLVNVCLFLPYQKGKSDFIFAWNRQKYTIIVLSQAVNSPTSHSLV